MLDIETRLAIGDLVTSFQYHLDRGGMSAELLHPDAVISSPAGDVCGREAILARPAPATGSITRHCWANMRLSMTADGGVVARYIATAWHGDAMRKLTKMTLGDVEDHFVRDADRWLLKHSRFERIFQAEY